MKIILRLIFVFLLFSGCSASYHIKKAEQKCPECFSEQSDTVINIIKRDTTIVIDTVLKTVVHDSLVVNEQIRINNDLLNNWFKKNNKKIINSDPVYKKENGISAKMWIKNNRIQGRFKIDSSIFVPYKYQLEIKNALIQKQTQIIKNKKIEIQKQESDFKKDMKTMFYVFISIIALIIILFVTKILFNK